MTFKNVKGVVSCLALGLMILPGAWGQENKDKLDKAGEATEKAVKKGGDAADKGLDAAGKGVGAAVEHTGRSVVKAGKAIAGKDTKKKKDPDAFDKAGKATERAFDKGGDATEKGLDATGKGTGAVVEHTGRGGVKAGKATAKAAKATGKAMEKTGGAVAEVFTDNESKKERVRAAQRALQAKGYYSGPIDGIVGPKTRSGLREFQKDHKLEPTGKLNDETVNRLGVS